MRTRFNAWLEAPALVAAALPGGAAGHAVWSAETVTSGSSSRAMPSPPYGSFAPWAAPSATRPGIVRAVGTRLTAAQRGRLAGSQGVLLLYDDETMTTNSRVGQD